jgi:hypothetical protein
MNLIVAVAAGLALAAAAGLRIFIPLLAVSIAGYTGHLALTPGTEWLATLPALIALAVAVALEVAAYVVPVLDHALDALGAPVAVIAGVLASASMFLDFPPLIRWALAVVAGGGSAGLVHGASALVRLKSSALTGGMLNPAVAGVELGGAVSLALLALLLPLAALALAIALVVLLVRWRRRPSSLA